MLLLESNVEDFFFNFLKFKCEVVPVHSIKTYWGEEIQLHSSLISALVQRKWPASRYGHFTPKNANVVPMNIPCELQRGSACFREENKISRARTEPQFLSLVQPVAQALQYNKSLGTTEHRSFGSPIIQLKIPKLAQLGAVKHSGVYSVNVRLVTNATTDNRLLQTTVQ